MSSLPRFRRLMIQAMTSHSTPLTTWRARLFPLPVWWVSSLKARLRLKMPRTKQTPVRMLRMLIFFFMTAHSSNSS